MRKFNAAACPKFTEKVLTILAEREDHIGAAPYERTNNRKAYSNGFKDRKLLTNSGELNLKVPQVREGDFYPSCLEKGEKIEQALQLALAEAYIQGVSTRRMKEITEKLCGKEISSTQVSRFAKVFDEEVDKFKNRPLGKYVYLYLDAQYEKVHYEGSVRSLAVLKAVAVNEIGTREVLGVSCSLSEAEVHWREFLENLQKRGMCGISLVISDDHAGLRKALQAVMPSVKWQRCLFHLAQNAGAQMPAAHMKKAASAAVREIYQAWDKDEAIERMKKVIERYADKAGKFCDWLEENFVEGLTFFDFPKDHWRKIRTNNLLERLNQEQKRRTRIIRLFPSISSCERVVVTIAMKMNEEWCSADKRYLMMK
ncbi:MAG: IS256 family transposase [Chlamydiia bacterium]|nr:IS256 family transposase [Chlamydiia bacterium]